MANKKSQNAGKKRVKFTLKTHPGSEVYVAGTFNDWGTGEKKLTDPKNNGEFAVTLMLSTGTYEYKFIVNGEWHVDPECLKWVRNAHGTLNSVITVG